MSPAEDCLAELRAAVGDPGRVSTRALDVHSLAHDASHFLLVPQAVVVARDAAEVAAVFATAARHGRGVTLRSGGTSLSGQGVSDQLLVDVRRHFTDVTVLDGGARVRVQPGVTVRALNARLAPYGRKFGPDPASEAAATVGGVIADNSSGMACGTTENSYRTLQSLVLVLASGTVVDTGAPDAEAHLAATEPELHAGLLRLRRRLLADPAAVARIEAQYAMKNTMGYGLNSLLDFETAALILAHLVVGSEGTLGFVAEATFVTVPLRPHAATSLLVFDDLFAANRALPALVGSRAATCELLDTASLRVGQSLADVPDAVADLELDRQAALLVEYQADTDAELAERSRAAGPTLAGLGAAMAPLTSATGPRARLWKLRKGLFTAVAWARPAGTTALLEDIAVPVDVLAETCAGLEELFTRHRYADAVIFGHARDGNVHFMITDRFAEPAALERYAAFTDDLVDLVLGRGGTLKAEHGTGRVMAPFVRRQFGDDLYAVMQQVKRLFDPRGTLNPGVLLDDDPRAHLRHIKATPTVEAEVDRCVECGYCEPVCPSRDLTLTPRQRIVARRAEAGARARGETALAAEIAEQYDYDGVQTCAVDGMCQTACPVGINTGDLVKRLRRDGTGPVTERAWAGAARHWDLATRAGSSGLSLAGVAPAGLVGGVNRVARRVFDHETVPQWSPDLPRGGPRRSEVAGPLRSHPGDELDAVYLPACVQAMFGPQPGAGAEGEHGAGGEHRAGSGARAGTLSDPGAGPVAGVEPASVSSRGRGVQWAVQELCARAGVRLGVPGDVDALCCGTPWSSKGLERGHQVATSRLQQQVLAATEGGVLPLVTDATSCTEGMTQALAGTGVEVVDALGFVRRRVLPLLRERGLLTGPRLPSLTLHPTCSSAQLGLDADLVRLGELVAERVHVPTSWACCGFAGDRGLLHPELTAAATAAEAAEVAGLDAAAHASCNRTCELGMTRATGHPYRHVLELLAERLPDLDTPG